MILSFSTALYANEECLLGAPSKIYEQVEDHFVARWDLAKKNAYDISDYVKTKDDLSYENWVFTNEANYTPLYSIQRHVEIGRRYGLSNELVTKVLNSELGVIRKINCLEKLLIRELFKVSSYQVTRSEFIAHVLTRDEDMRVYFDYHDYEYGGYTSVLTNKNLRNDIKEGWIYLRNIHNHPFSFKKNKGEVGGILIPSETDIRFYKKIISKKVIITNGLHSIEITNEEINKI